MLVTIYGSSGFVGRNLAKRLVADGEEVQLIDPAAEGCASSSSSSSASPRLRVFASPSLPPRAIVFLAQSPHYRQLPEMAWHLFAVNVAAAIQAAQEARDAGVTRFIYASSGSVYVPGLGPLSETSPLRHDDWYALSKIQAEEALALFAGDLDVTIVRPFCIFGPGQANMLVPNLLEAILAGRRIYVEPIAGDGSDRDGLRISPCYIDDAVDVLCTMIHRGATAALSAAVRPDEGTAAKGAAVAPDAHATPEIVNLAGPEVISIRQLATELGRLAGKTPNIEISPRCRQGNLIADLALLRRSYQPRFTSLATALERTVQHTIGQGPVVHVQPSGGQP